MNDLLHDFLSDTSEALDGLDDQLTRLADDPEDHRLAASLFHILHTISGAAGVLGLPRLAALARAGELLLAQSPRPENVATTLSVFGRIKDVTAYLAAFGVEPAGDDLSLLRAGEAAGQRVVERGLADVPGAVRMPATFVLEHAVAAPEGRLSTQRVPTATLDDILGVASELVLIRNQLAAAAVGDGGVGARPLHDLSRAAAALRQSALRARLAPFSRAAEPLTRLTATIAHSLGKPAQLHIDGGDVLLDVPLFEAARRAMPELIRNAMRHGVETLDERRAAHKPDMAQLHVAAREVEGCLVLSVSDDGRGFNVLPPGRGAGLSIVRSAAQALGGGLRVTSTPKLGARVELRLPQALAVMQALVLCVGDEIYAVPHHAVGEVVDLVAPDACALDHCNGALVLRSEGGLRPCVSLAEMLALPPAAGGGQCLLLIDNSGAPYGVLVDAVLGIEEIVARPLPKLPGASSLFCGACLMADGRPALILSASGLAAAMGLGQPEEFHFAPVTHAPAPPPRLLLFRDIAGALAAAPLSAALRVEPLRQSAVVVDPSLAELSPDAALRLNNRLIPLLAWPRAAAGFTFAAAAGRHCLIIGASQAAFALAVAEALDQIEIETPIMAAPGETGVTGAFMHSGERVRILDLAWLTRRASLCQQALEDSGASARAALLIDADPITGDMLRLTLEAGGLLTWHVESIAAGLAFIEAGGSCDVLICDLGIAAVDAARWTRLRNACGPAGKTAIGLCAIVSDGAQDLAQGLRLHRLVGKFDRAALTSATRAALAAAPEAA